LDPFANDPISYTKSNSNSNPSIDLGLITNNYNSNGPNSTIENFVSTPSVYCLFAYRPSYVCYCCYCKCCRKCSKCCGLLVVFVQSSHISPSKCRWSWPSRNFMSCSVLTSYLCSLNCVSYGDVICGTSCLCSLIYPSCGDVICGTSCLCFPICPSYGNVICGTSCLCCLIYPSCGDVIYRTFASTTSSVPPTKMSSMVPL
jgi:hypothetical protein